MYKNAVDLAQRRARQLWLSDLQGAAWDELPDDEKRANLVRAKKAVEKHLVSLPKKDPERVALGQLLHEIDERIIAIRPKMKCPGVASFFIDVCKERLTKPHYNALMNEAAKRLREAQEKLNDKDD